MNSTTQTGLNKLCGIFNIIKCNGGLAKLLRQLYRINDAKNEEWIEEALNGNTTCSECALLKDNPEEAMMTARLLKWFNDLTKDCFLLVPAKRLASCDELSRLHHNLSPSDLIEPLSFWDCFAHTFPPATIQMTELFGSESLDSESTRYYLAVTKNNREDSADSDDNVDSHLQTVSITENLPFSSTAHNCNALASLREQVTDKNVSIQKSKLGLGCCTMRPCTTKTCKKVGILNPVDEKLGSLREKHNHCTSELEIECKEPRKCIRRRFASKKVTTTSKMDVGKKGEKNKKLQIENKVVDDLAKAMEFPVDENKSAVMDNLGKQNDLNNILMDSKEIAANNKVINQEMDNLNNSLKLSCTSDCKPKKPCKSGHDDSCGDKKHAKKPEGGCGGGSSGGGTCGSGGLGGSSGGGTCGSGGLGGSSGGGTCGSGGLGGSSGGSCGDSKKGSKCGDGSKDEGSCVPALHRKPDPCEKDHVSTEGKVGEKDSSRNLKSKAQFNKKMQETRIKYKIRHCRRSKINWGRGDFNKRARNDPGDACGDQPKAADICSEH